MAEDSPQVPRELEQWLVIATDRLAPEAVAQVRSEILDHFAEAVDELQQQGHPAEQAIARAIQNLGSPQKAQRSFKRNHLTINEKQFLRERKKDFCKAKTLIWEIVEIIFAFVFAISFFWVFRLIFPGYKPHWLACGLFCFGALLSPAVRLYARHASQVSMPDIARFLFIERCGVFFTMWSIFMNNTFNSRLMPLPEKALVGFTLALFIILLHLLYPLLVLRKVYRVKHHNNLPRTKEWG